MAAAVPLGGKPAVSFEASADVLLLSIENKPPPRSRAGKPNEDRAYVGILGDLTPLPDDFEIMEMMQTAAQELSESLKESDAGSTASIGFVWDEQIYIAHIGDATLGLVSESEGAPAYHSLHPWHHGCVKLPYGRINVGRAFGDKECREVAGDKFGEVECSVATVGEDDVILAFSDGLPRVIGDAVDQEENDTVMTELLKTLHASEGSLSPAGIASATQAKALEFRASTSGVDDLTLIAAKPRQGALIIVADGHGASGTNSEVAAAVIRDFPAKWAACLGRDFTPVCQTDEAAMAARLKDHRLASYPFLEEDPIMADPLTDQEEIEQTAAIARLEEIVMAQAASYPELAVVAAPGGVEGAFSASALSGGSGGGGASGDADASGPA